MEKNLKELIDFIGSAEVAGLTDKWIRTITHDSRRRMDDGLFICIAGTRADGHDYAAQAAANGAVAVLAERDVAVPDGVTVVKVDCVLRVIARLAPYFYDYPSRRMRLIGVTGTNGKTTTTYLLRDILRRAGFRVGLIGTIQILIEDEAMPVQNTTPDVVNLQEILHRMRAAEMDYVVMEVSSHALAQDRVSGCEFDVGVFTNMTRDHLDFHGTFENYFDAKARLFDGLGDGGNAKRRKAAVINLDDAAGAAMRARARATTIGYGVEAGRDVRARDIEVLASGTRFTVDSFAGTFSLALKITGVFNVYNVLAAVGAALAEGVDAAVAKEALEAFQSVPGRFELVRAGQPFTIIVDYAHTPDGLENVLKTARRLTEGRLIVVFGCGGDRDRTKRPIMGKLAAEWGDIVIATSDNPRTEDPALILSEVEAGVREGLKTGKRYEKIIDRRAAIVRAITCAGPADTVLIAGKGHETYQILPDRTIHFDDREIAREAVGGLA